MGAGVGMTGGCSAEAGVSEPRSRQEIEALLGTKVFLEIWVKVKENWRDSDIALSNFGYKE